MAKLVRCMVNSTQHGYDKQKQRLMSRHVHKLFEWIHRQRGVTHAKRAWKYTKVKHTAPIVKCHSSHPVFICNQAFIHDLVFIRDPTFITLTCTETPPMIK